MGAKTLQATTVWEELGEDCLKYDEDMQIYCMNSLRVSLLYTYLSIICQSSVNTIYVSISMCHLSITTIYVYIYHLCIYLSSIITYVCIYVCIYYLSTIYLCMYVYMYILSIYLSTNHLSIFWDKILKVPGWPWTQAGVVHHTWLL